MKLLFILLFIPGCWGHMPLNDWLPESGQISNIITEEEIYTMSVDMDESISAEDKLENRDNNVGFTSVCGEDSLAR